jgi:hypothetical protein
MWAYLSEIGYHVLRGHWRDSVLNENNNKKSQFY